MCGDPMGWMCDECFANVRKNPDAELCDECKKVSDNMCHVCGCQVSPIQLVDGVCYECMVQFSKPERCHAANAEEENNVSSTKSVFICGIMEDIKDIMVHLEGHINTGTKVYGLENDSLAPLKGSVVMLRDAYRHLDVERTKPVVEVPKKQKWPRLVVDNTKGGKNGVKIS